jgi:HEAT repeat protein
VRLEVARGLASVAAAGGADPLAALAVDPDLRVRAAAVEGLGVVRADDPAVSAAVGDDAWELRKAAAIALGHAGDGAVALLLGATGDDHADVRRAAVQSLARWAQRDDVRVALDAAAGDPDADVRGYARLALSR